MYFQFAAECVIVIAFLALGIARFVLGYGRLSRFVGNPRVAFSKNLVLSLLYTSNPDPTAPPPPKPADGEIVVWYGGWSLKQFVRSRLRRFLEQQNVHDEWSCGVEPGYYRVRLRFPNTAGLDRESQLDVVQRRGSGWKPAPEVLAATAYVMILARTNSDPLMHDECRCADTHLSGIDNHIVMGGGGLAHFDILNDSYKNDHLWLAAAQKC